MIEGMKPWRASVLLLLAGCKYDPSTAASTADDGSVPEAADAAPMNDIDAGNPPAGTSLAGALAVLGNDLAELT